MRAGLASRPRGTLEAAKLEYDARTTANNLLLRGCHLAGLGQAAPPHGLCALAHRMDILKLHMPEEAAHMHA